MKMGEWVWLADASEKFSKSDEPKSHLLSTWKLQDPFLNSAVDAIDCMHCSFVLDSNWSCSPSDESFLHFIVDFFFDNDSYWGCSFCVECKCKLLLFESNWNLQCTILIFNNCSPLTFVALDLRIRWYQPEIRVERYQPALHLTVPTSD